MSVTASNSISVAASIFISLTASNSMSVTVSNSVSLAASIFISVTASISISESES